ncbi:MAG: carboxypeptidase regulatory-like domain-containing protein [Bryobacteraceae bacterium]
MSLKKTLLALIFPAALWAQSITTGAVTGIVTDPTGGGIADANVTLTGLATNASQTTQTGTHGDYRFAFVAPGAYKVEVTESGFQSKAIDNLVVVAGQPISANFQLEIASARQVVEVTEGAIALQTQNADTTTTFNTQMIQNLPNPGGDITYIAQTAPGVVMNTQAGYGNFVANGMPGTSNLFSINGQNYNDPFSGINNSGASNLLLGSNDISEANVINNAYSAQYGQYAGSQITYITKSGSNDFHGNAVYMWNGRALNANQFFSNQVGQPTPFNNFNQWAAGMQGPIWKNHTFFDVDYEGLRNLLPTASALTLVPSPQFQAATLANLAAIGQSAQIPFYNKIFGVYNGAPGVGAATPVPASQGYGCQGFTGLPAGVPCADEFRTTPPNINKEYQWSARVDHNFSDKDHGYIRVLRDNGFQPTFTSPFGPTFNAQSNQPQMNAQISETHTFGPNTVNQFSGSALFIVAVFTPSNASAALAALPAFMTFSGGAFSSVGAFAEPGPFYYPQGTRIFQYQILDDFSHVQGRHTFRAGFSWLHDTVTDLDFQAVGGPILGAITTNLSDFFNGGGINSSLNQVFPSSPEEGLRFNTFGGYIADDWRISSGLTLSLNVRLESYSNPTCEANCFGHLATTFNGSPVANATTTPYNQFIISGQHNAYSNTQAVVWEPRLGIAWKPFGSSNTVIRTGAGIFADELPGLLAEAAAFNSPGLNAFTIGSGAIAPGVPGSLFTTTAAANQALRSQFSSGGSFNSISATVPGFAPPNFFSFPSYFNQPTYYKWNFEIQQAITPKMTLTLNYSGMHGSHLPIADEGLNGYCPPSVCATGFAGLPAAPPNPALGLVTQYLSAGNSNYNGLTVSFERRLSAGLTFNLNYTWSHALDDVSNGGVANLPFGILDTDPSITLPQNTFNIRGNYGSADYDVRHYLSANFVLTDMFRHAGLHWGPNRIFGGWTLSSNWFFRTGLPFTPIDNSALDALLGFNYDGSIFASPATSSLSANCGNAVNTACLTTSQFAPSYAISGALSGFGTAGRNSLRGPNFFDVDMALMKDVAITERVRFSFGVHTYNLFNHPNFDQPVNDIANSQFGYSIAAVGPPTSILGSFVGAGSSPRFVEIKGTIQF